MKVREKIRIFREDVTLTRFLKGIMFLTIVQIGVFFFMFRSLPPQVPLFYSLPWGEVQLAPSWYLLFFPGISLSILAVNVTILLLAPIHERLLWKILIITAAFIGFLATIDLVKIIFLIT